MFCERVTIWCWGHWEARTDCSAAGDSEAKMGEASSLGLVQELGEEGEGMDRK